MSIEENRHQIHEILSEAKDVLEQFELEIREAPKDSKFLFLSEIYFGVSMYLIFIIFIF